MGLHETSTSIQGVDLNKVDQKTPQESAIDTIRRAHATFGDRLYALSSFGVDSAVMLQLIEDSGEDIPVLTIDTGFWFPETHEFQEILQSRFGFTLEVYGPEPETVEVVQSTKLWQTDTDSYHEITKLEPTRRAIQDLGIVALLSGIRHSQTPNRAQQQPIAIGTEGEHRIHPILGWKDEDIQEFIDARGLPRHPLYAEGYDSVGDWTTTSEGRGRSGRAALGPHLECGLHVVSSDPQKSI